MEKLNNTHVENDKTIAPFLLAASFQGLIKFIGSENKNGVLYWKFSPSEDVKYLLQQLKTKTEPRIPAIDLFEAISTWWQEIAEMRNGEIGYGRDK